MKNSSLSRMASQLTVNATRRTCLGMSLLAALTLAGCATPTGPVFSRVEAPPPGKAQLYLYRKSALYAVAAKYYVAYAATKEPLGELFNASYLVLPLDPGRHAISVDERGFQAAKVFEVQAEAGKTYFVEYDSSKGLLLGWCLLSDSSHRTEAQALADLRDLRRAN